VISFESEHFEMGIMYFMPEIGGKYTAKIKYCNIYETEVPLPIPEKEGFVMGVE
jgi:hypothetical protein